MYDYSNPFQAYINEQYGQYGMNPNGLRYNIWSAYPNPSSSSNQLSSNNNNNNNNNNNSDDDPWKLFGENFAKSLLSDPIGNVANIWNTYNTWKNDKAKLNMQKDYFNMQKDAYQNNERRMEQSLQEHRANRYGSML